MATPPSLPNVLPPEQPAAPPRTSGLAITSLVLGILSLLGGALLLAPPVLAVVFGHISAANCKKDRSLSGAGLGIAGLVMGYVAFAVQFGLYVSPVGFLSTKVPEEWRLLYSVNPMVGVIDGFRWCLLGGQNTIYWPGLLLSLLVVGFLLVTGIWYFRKTEKGFADII